MMQTDEKIQKEDRIKTFEELECTYHLMGDYPYLQPKFNCQKCKEAFICIKCIQTCHNHSGDEHSKLPKPANHASKFTCRCGKDLKHKIEEVNVKTKYSHCNLKKFEKSLSRNKRYFCDKHKVEICEICTKRCHSGPECKNSIKVTELKENLEGDNSCEFACKCINDNHSNHNLFCLKVSTSDYKPSPDYFYILQLTNKMFSSGVMDELKKFIRNILERQIFFDENFQMIVSKFHEDISNRIYRASYFIEELKETFPYDLTLKYINKYKPENRKQVLTKFYLISILFAFHVKNDFKNIKSLSTSDFKINSIFDRINYRKFISSSNDITNSIHLKFKINLTESLSMRHQHSLKNLILNLPYIFSEKISEIHYMDMPKFRYCLKMICFLLKRLIFSIDELHMLINNFYDFFIVFYNQYKDNCDGGKDTLNDFKTFAKMFLLIAITYNDFVMAEKLNNNQIIIHENFIQLNNEYTEKLLKMIIMNSKLFSNYSDEWSSNPYFESTNKLINESMNLYLISDNIYYKQIRSWKNEYNLRIDDGICFYAGETIDSPFYKLKTNIHMILEEIFFLKNDAQGNQSDYNYDHCIKTIMSLEEFGLYFTKNDQKNIHVIEKSKTNEQLLLDTINLESKHYIKLSKYIERDFHFISLFKKDIYKMNNFLQNMMDTSLDKSITSMLVIFNRKEEKLHFSKDDIKYVLKFLSIFILTKTGTKYFLTGCNLIRIISLLEFFPLEVMDFLHLVFKAIKFFKIDLSAHKIILGIRDAILSNKINFDGNKIDFMMKVVGLLKIINDLENFFEYEDYEKIKIDLANKIINDKQDFIYKEDEFQRIFEEEEAKASTHRSEFKEKEANANFTAFEIMNPIDEPENERENLLLLNRGDFNSNNLLIHEENKEDYSSTKEKLTKLSKVKKPSEIPTLSNFKFSECQVMYKFYFSFFKLLVKNFFFYYYKEEVYSKLYQKIMNFIEKPIRSFLSARSVLLTILKRRILLRTIRTFYFIDGLDRNDIEGRYKPLNNLEYEYVKMHLDSNLSEFIIKSKKQENYYGRIKEEDYKSKVKPKYDQVINLRHFMEVFQNELKNIKEIIGHHKNTESLRKKVRHYVYELINSIKHISDFIFTQEIWNGLNISFYKLAKEFISQAEVLRKIINLHQPDVKSKVIPPTTFKNSLLDDNFDFFNKREIFKAVTETYFILISLKGDNFDNTLKSVDKFTLLNFSPYSLIDPKHFNSFYTNEKQVYPTKIPEFLKDIYKSYKAQLSDFENSTFLDLVWKKFTDFDVDYGKCIIDYIVKQISMERSYQTRKILFSNITTLNYMMFYDTEGTQKKLKYLLKSDQDEQQSSEYEDEDDDSVQGEGKVGHDVKGDEEYLNQDGEANNQQEEERITYVYHSFWNNINNHLQENLILNISCSKNIFSYKSNVKVLLLTQEIIHFLQILSEKESQIYHTMNFNPLNKGSKSFFEELVDYLIIIVDLMKFDFIVHFKLPYDTLLVFFNNIIDYVIEYIEAVDKEKSHYDIIKETMENKIFKNLSKLLFINLNKDTQSTPVEGDKNNQPLITQREKILFYMKLKLIKLLISYTDKKPEDIHYITRQYPTHRLFEEIHLNFIALTNHFIERKLLPENLYCYNFHQFYIALRQLYLYNEDFRENLKFKVCCEIFHLIKILVRVYRQQNLRQYLEENDIDPKSDNGRLSKNDPDYTWKLTYKIYIFLRSIIVRIDIFKDGQNCPIYFHRPLITYYLTKQTKSHFLKNVNRDNAFSKLNELIQKSDFFIFEMICNFHSGNRDFFSEFFQRINYNYFEQINYLIILAQQCLLIYNFYHSTELPNDVYNSFDSSKIRVIPNENLFVGIIQFLFLFFVMSTWIIFKFPQNYQEVLMKNLQKKFVFKNTAIENKNESTSYRTVKEIYRGENLNDFKIVRKINKNVSKMQLFYALIDSVVLNREINVLCFNLIMIILYLCIGSPMILVVPTIFVMNLSSTLYDILVALKLRWRQLLAVLLFNYLCIYIFTWISMLWINKLFLYSDATDLSVR
jgi:hypothetical protein